MDSTKKFQQAYDALLKDLNAKIEEVKTNLQHLSSDVKIQVEGQRENLQEYGEKIKGRINQIVDVDKVRATVLADAENVVDEAKVRIEKLFQYINEQVHTGEQKAKKAASDLTKKAEKASVNLEKEVKKATKEIQKDVELVSNKLDKGLSALS